MKHILALLLVFSSLFASIDTQRFTSFSINNGDLHLENGAYLEALNAYYAAFSASDDSEMKAKAMLREATLRSLYLDDKYEAVSLYKKVLTHYQNTSSVEYAYYSLGMLYKDLGKKDKSLDTFSNYLKKFPNGNFSNQVEFNHRRLTKKTKVIPKKNELLIEKVTTQKATPPNIRVLIANTKSIHLNATSGIQVNKKTYEEVHLKYAGGKLYLNDTPIRTTTLTSKSPIYVKEKKTTYEGKLVVTVYKNKLALINILPIDTYLYGVVTSESLASWNIEALKSQAVAARTYALYQAKVRKKWPFDIKDNTYDQVYKGLEGKTKKSVEAVDSTLGVVLLWKNKVILSQYTASSGWFSASSKEIFNTNKPYLYAHKDIYSQAMPNGSWKKKISIETFEKNLNKRGFNFKGIYALEPFKVGPSGRTLSTKVKAQNGEKVLRTYSTVRRAADLKDILFTVRNENGYFIFEGGGFGHGVGYSQWGGQKMAKEGYKYSEILKFYYKDVEVKKLW